MPPREMKLLPPAPLPPPPPAAENGPFATREAKGTSAAIKLSAAVPCTRVRPTNFTPPSTYFIIRSAIAPRIRRLFEHRGNINRDNPAHWSPAVTNAVYREGGGQRIRAYPAHSPYCNAELL